ncbi:MAG: universal stress protein [Acidimicrobiales bacterium]|nr:universal stress protein [Acidimicrobiales bacterium]
MRTIAITPPGALRRAAPLAAAAGWELEPSPDGHTEADDAALATGEPLLVVPPQARVARRLRRILVVHEGSPLVAPAVELADEAALQSGAEIVVLHAASASRPRAPGSLPAPRFVDHSGYDWAEWRAEFLRRFCRCSEGLCVNLEVAVGQPAVAVPAALPRLRPDLVIATWKGQAGAGRGRLIRLLLREASSPVLVLREPTSPK